jgi:hypothetical protein
MIVRVKTPAFIVTCVIIALGIFALMSESSSLSGALFFTPFALGPLFISLFVASINPVRTSQIILIAGSILYATWFAFVFLSAFYWHIDAQSAIALLFIGIYSLPLMIPVWLIAFWLNKRNNSGEQGDAHQSTARSELKSK